MSRDDVFGDGEPEALLLGGVVGEVGVVHREPHVERERDLDGLFVELHLTEDPHDAPLSPVVFFWCVEKNENETFFKKSPYSQTGPKSSYTLRPGQFGKSGGSPELVRDRGETRTVGPPSRDVSHVPLKSKARFERTPRRRLFSVAGAYPPQRTVPRCAFRSKVSPMYVSNPIRTRIESSNVLL